jgi:hypothetical protein
MGRKKIDVGGVAVLMLLVEKYGCEGRWGKSNK